MKLNRLFFKILPFLICVITGFLVYISSIFIPIESLKNLTINISATLLAIPLVFMFYQSIENFSRKKLNRELIDYAKLQVDSEILSIINQLQKVVYPLEQRDNSLSGINNFLSLKLNDIIAIIKSNQYIGFQIFKHWEITENNITEILKHPLIVNRFDDEIIICIISILKDIRTIERIQNYKELYIDTNKTAEKYKVVNGSQMNSSNEKYPDRCLLLKQLKDDNFLVLDFGDISLYNMPKTLNYFRVNSDFINILSESIYDLITEFNKWGKLTGNEFLLDLKTFRILPKKSKITNKEAIAK